MSTETEKIGLFKYDPDADGSRTFNIRQALNENWDKIDQNAKDVSAAFLNIDKTIAGLSPDKIGAASNQNLLVNWLFADPIDQRGGYLIPPGKLYQLPYYPFTEIGTTDQYYTVDYIDTSNNPHFTIDGTEYFVDSNRTSQAYVRGYIGTNIYTIDGWKIQHSGEIVPIKIGSNGLSLNHGSDVWNYSEIFQPLEAADIEYLTGKQVTLSALVGGSLYTKTFVFGTDNHVSGFAPNLDFIHISAFSFYPYFRFVGGDVIDFTACKLELGSTQTLAHQDANGNWIINDPPPNKSDELLKCCMRTADPNDTYANNKKTPKAINAVNKAGDTMTGTLKAPIIEVLNSDSTRRSARWLDSSNNLLMNNAKDSNNWTQFMLGNESNTDLVFLRRMKDGVQSVYQMYTEETITRSTTDISSGSTALRNGWIHLVYE